MRQLIPMLIHLDQLSEDQLSGDQLLEESKVVVPYFKLMKNVVLL